MWQWASLFPSQTLLLPHPVATAGGTLPIKAVQITLYTCPLVLQVLSCKLCLDALEVCKTRDVPSELPDGHGSVDASAESEAATD